MPSARVVLLCVALAAVLGCRRSKSGQAPAARAGVPVHPEAILLPSANDPGDGVWARGCARLMARQLDHAAGRDRALVALVLGASSKGVGYVLPSAPFTLDQAAAAARRYGATSFVRVHIHAPDAHVKNILMDVFSVEGLATKFSRVYPWNPHVDLPSLRSASVDLAGALGMREPDRVLEEAPFVQTRSPIALEAFLGALDNLTLAAAARGRPVGPAFRTPASLLDEALGADPAFQAARVLREAGPAGRFDRVLVSEVRLKD